MRIPKRGEKGFTLIELLIVVAILGVLAAVVIPNVGRFMGRGEEEARRVEFNTVRTAITAMMVENDLTTLPTPSHPYTEAAGAANDATNDMSAFPDSSATAAAGAGVKSKDPSGDDYELADQDGYYLYQHDIIGDGSATTGLINSVSTNPMVYYYTCESSGEIRQWASADTTDATGPEYTE